MVDLAFCVVFQQNCLIKKKEAAHQRFHSYPDNVGHLVPGLHILNSHSNKSVRRL